MPDGDAPLSYQIALVGEDKFTPAGAPRSGDGVTISGDPGGLMRLG
jgi:hypothetical protein